MLEGFQGSLNWILWYGETLVTRTALRCSYSNAACGSRGSIWIYFFYLYLSMRMDIFFVCVWIHLYIHEIYPSMRMDIFLYGYICVWIYFFYLYLCVWMYFFYLYLCVWIYFFYGCIFGYLLRMDIFFVWISMRMNIFFYTYMDKNIGIYTYLYRYIYVSI